MKMQPGWINRQCASLEREARTWPEWMLREIRQRGAGSRAEGITMGTLMNLPLGKPTPTGADVSAPDFGGLTDTQSVFNRYYVNSRPKEIRELMALPTLQERIERARELVSSGSLKIDWEIDVMTLDAFTTMAIRLADGLLGVKPLEPADFHTSLGTPGATDGSNYDREPYKREPLPLNAIKVSLRLADYPVAQDLRMRPRPFGLWPTKYAPGSGMDRNAIGNRYEALNQSVVMPSGAWVNYVDPDLPIGAVYEEVWTVRSASLPGLPLRVYVEYVRIK